MIFSSPHEFFDVVSPRMRSIDSTYLRNKIEKHNDVRAKIKDIEGIEVNSILS